jgi:hypothetical protein
VSLLVLLFLRGHSNKEEFSRNVGKAFLVNAINVGLLGALSLAYKKNGIPPDQVTLKLRSNFWQHALPSFISICVLMRLKQGTDWKYLLFVVGMQILYFCVPYNGKFGFAKYDAVYDSSVKPLVFLMLSNSLLFGNAYAILVRPHVFTSRSPSRHKCAAISSFGTAQRKDMLYRNPRTAITHH